MTAFALHVVGTRGRGGQPAWHVQKWGVCPLAARLGFSGGPDSEQVLAESAVTASF